MYTIQPHFVVTLKHWVGIQGFTRHALLLDMHD